MTEDFDKKDLYGPFELSGEVFFYERREVVVYSQLDEDGQMVATRIHRPKGHWWRWSEGKYSPAPRAWADALEQVFLEEISRLMDTGLPPLYDGKRVSRARLNLAEARGRGLMQSQENLSASEACRVASREFGLPLDAKSGYCRSLYNRLTSRARRD